MFAAVVNKNWVEMFPVLQSMAQGCTPFNKDRSSLGQQQ
jgi:hypothetical protein